MTRYVPHFEKQALHLDGRKERKDGRNPSLLPFLPSFLLPFSLIRRSESKDKLYF
jgi:hypothetical protein